ncbi:hypothetical protein BX616_002071 [Lobosporangium transversale]|nr:hypothetical protein BX616_002071 [Lobosporangium transversale]
MKQYVWKEYNALLEKPVLQPEKEEGRQRKKDIDEMGRGDLARTMSWEHFIATLNVGTVAVNVKGALKEAQLSLEMKRCLDEAVLLAANTKRSWQEILGQFLE